MNPATTIRIRLPRLHPVQRQIVREARRFNVLCCGRRFGKTKLAIDRLIHPALRGRPVAYFAPTYKMLSDVWREAKSTFRPVVSRVSEQERRLELISGGIVDFWSLDHPNVARGRKYARVVIDEAAMIPALEDAWLKVLRPTLTDCRGDAWFSSTPSGLNFFFQLFTWGQDQSRPEWASWQRATNANPFIDPAEIEAARRDLPEMAFRQEYLAEFLRGAGAVFRNLATCLKAQPSTPAEHAGHSIRFGVDWAQKVDFTVICGFCATCRREVFLDRFNQIGWALQRGRLAARAAEWRPEQILAEENSIGGPNIEALQQEGLPVTGFQTTATTKPQLIQSLALCFEKAEAQWLSDPIARAELEAYEATISRLTGRVSYSAPEGLHDDTVIARGLTWWTVANAGVGIYL